jgi:hypothetical protein
MELGLESASTDADSASGTAEGNESDPIAPGSLNFHYCLYKSLSRLICELFWEVWDNLSSFPVNLFHEITFFILPICSLYSSKDV